MYRTCSGGFTSLYARPALVLPLLGFYFSRVARQAPVLVSFTFWITVVRHGGESYLCLEECGWK